IDPVRGPVGTSVTIAGSGFGAGSTATIGGVALGSLAVNTTAQTITGTVGAATPMGAQAVAMTSGTQTSTDNVTFTVTESTPLPVQLLAFTATAQGPATVQLAWATASEQNSARFEVERSLDGLNFSKLGAVAAAGTSAAAHAYGFADALLPTGARVLYYRLRQVDLDGTATYSPVRSVARAASGLALYPNPAPHQATLVGAPAAAAVQVYDAVGRLVLRAAADAAGTAGLVLPAGLPGGVYVVRVGEQALRLVVE
ncbi:MAG: T9SS type A sorting domain-containing protein, partial [Hymenobacter sp.]